MKKTAILITVVTVVGLAVMSAIPALAQERNTEPAVTCPYHDRTNMSHEDMEQWMGSSAQDEWMDSAEHPRIHESMMGTGNMTGGAGNMMGASG